jgi:hypothetical protein
MITGKSIYLYLAFFFTLFLSFHPVFSQTDAEIREFSHQFALPSQKMHYSDYLLSARNEIQVIFSGLFLFYKEFISPQDFNSCNYFPSCSVYMLESVREKGFAAGFLNGLDRLMRCHSMIEPGLYPVSEEMNKYYDPVEKN